MQKIGDSETGAARVKIQRGFVPLYPFPRLVSFHPRANKSPPSGCSSSSTAVPPLVVHYLLSPNDDGDWVRLRPSSPFYAPPKVLWSSHWLALTYEAIISFPPFGEPPLIKSSLSVLRGFFSNRSIIITPRWESRYSMKKNNNNLWIICFSSFSLRPSWSFDGLETPSDVILFMLNF